MSVLLIKATPTLRVVFLSIKFKIVFFYLVLRKFSVILCLLSTVEILNGFILSFASVFYDMVRFLLFHSVTWRILVIWFLFMGNVIWKKMLLDKNLIRENRNQFIIQWMFCKNVIDFYYIVFMCDIDKSWFTKRLLIIA